MASIYRRIGRNGQTMSKWSYHYVDHNGHRVTGTGSRDKTVTRAIAEHLEAESKLVRSGLKAARDLTAEKSGRLPMSSHVGDYQLHLVDKGDTRKHALHVASAIQRVTDDAKFDRLPQIAQDALQSTLRRIRTNLSSRTANHALGAFKGFLRWCEHSGRIVEAPKWLGAIKPYPESGDRRRVRRTVTPEEITKLLTATEGGPNEVCYGHTMDRRNPILVRGSDRAMLYRLAMATGLRDKELRSLTPEDFDLSARTVRCRADNTKNSQEASQPISSDLCERLSTWLANRPTHKPVFTLPWSSSKMLRKDLELAGIPHTTSDGIIDMHAFRHTYISRLIERGVDPKTVQVLARHSTITLTIDRYSHTTDDRKRKAIEG